MSHPVSGHDERGSSAVGEPRRKRPIWLWILLALILLALLLFLLSRCGGGDSQKQSSASGTSSASATATSPAPSDTSTPSASPADSGTGVSAGRLTSAGTSVLAQDASSTTGALSSFDGKPVKASAVVVRSVPADEGFWVGPSVTDRVWVQLTGAGESGYSVKKGDSVDFAGTMVRHGSPFAAKVGVTAPEGAAQLTREMAHVRVRQGAVTLSK